MLDGRNPKNLEKNQCFVMLLVDYCCCEQGHHEIVVIIHLPLSAASKLGVAPKKLL